MLDEFMELEMGFWKRKIDFQYSSMAPISLHKLLLPSHVYQYLRALKNERFHRLLELVLIQIRFECNNAFDTSTLFAGVCCSMFGLICAPWNWLHRMENDRHLKGLIHRIACDAWGIHCSMKSFEFLRRHW